MEHYKLPLVEAKFRDTSCVSAMAKARARARARARVMARVGLELGVWPRWCRLYLWSIPHLCVIDSKLWLPG